MSRASFWILFIFFLLGSFAFLVQILGPPQGGLPGGMSVDEGKTRPQEFTFPEPIRWRTLSFPRQMPAGYSQAPTARSFGPDYTPPPKVMWRYDPMTGKWRFEYPSP